VCGLLRCLVLSGWHFKHTLNLLLQRAKRADKNIASKTIIL
jgi:hypothetical protein